MSVGQLAQAIIRSTHNLRFAYTLTDYLRTKKHPIYITIARTNYTRQNFSWATQILGFKTMELIATFEHQDPFDGLADVRMRLAYDRHNESWRRIINQSYKYAVLEVINRYSGIAQFIALPEGCPQCDSSFGYCLRNKQKVTRCYECHRSIKVHSMWEKGATNERPSISKEIRRLVYEDASGHCYICEKVCDFDINATVDHVIPIDLANSLSVWTRPWIHSLNNMQLACRSCNSRKGKKTA